MARKHLHTQLRASHAHTTHRNRQSTFSPLTPYLPLPKYFESEWSYAQYRIPAQSAHISLNAPPARAPTADVTDEDKCVVGWIYGPVTEGDDQSPATGQPVQSEYQLVALTYTGGWYRLSLPATAAAAAVASSTMSSPGPSLTPLSASPPSVRGLAMARPRSPSSSSVVSRTERGKGKEREKEREKEKESRECTLREFRRYGRWDGWG